MTYTDGVVWVIFFQNYPVMCMCYGGLCANCELDMATLTNVRNSESKHQRKLN